jgi:chemotaxis protein methyltransferase CheR
MTMKASMENVGLPEVLLARLSSFISERIGLYFPPRRWPDLQRGLRTAAQELGFDDLAGYAERLLAGILTQRETEILASHLTVGETYFFREIKTFDALEQTILPELIKARRGKVQRLRLWSAGCSSGEEPYSLAILLRKLLPDLPDWQVTVLATDINPHSLEKAAAGEYGEWSFRELSPAIKERYFRKASAKRYEIDREVRKMVAFEYLNLADDSYPSLTTNTNAIDVIFCRNVLIYFEPERVGKVIGNLRRSLMDGGWLIVGASEVSQAAFSEFVTVSFPGTTAYRKPRFGESPKRTTAHAESPPSFQAPAIFEAAPVVKPSPLPAVFEIPSPPVTEKATYAEGLALYQQGRYGDVLEKLRTVALSGGAESETLALCARASANQGDLAAALTLCERALAADKVNPRLYYLRATIQQEQGAVTGAAASLKQSLYLDSDFALAHFALGNLARQQGRTAEAGKHYKNALQALRKCQTGDELPESDGLTAGRLAAIISSWIQSHG